jgi:hypothetical protein
MALTTPADDTVAIDESEVVHRIVPAETELPDWSLGKADIFCDVPGSSANVLGTMSIEATDPVPLLSTSARASISDAVSARL